jgi:hypothetical protein
MLRKLLQEHVEVASDFLKLYESNDFLREEVAILEHKDRLTKRAYRDLDQLEFPRVAEYFDHDDPTKPNVWPASKQLRQAIKNMKDCQSKINSLDKDTRAVIQLVGNSDGWTIFFPLPPRWLTEGLTVAIQPSVNL